MIIKIRVKIIHPLGHFEGFLQTTDENITKDEANEVVTGLIENVNSITYLALVDSDGSQTVFTKNILSSAIITYSVLEDYFKE